MAQLKDSLITGDLRVTGTIYGVGSQLTKEDSNNTINFNLSDKSGILLSSISIFDATTQTHGLMSATDKSKLDNTNLVNINGSSQNGGNIYAPTSGGNSGQMIVSTGTGAPEWKTVGYTTINTGYMITNGIKMTASVDNNGVLLFTSSSVGITSSGTTSVVNGFNGVVSSSVPNGNEVSY